MFYKIEGKFAAMILFFKKTCRFFLLYFISLVIIISSCRQLDIFEKNTNIPAMKWQYNFNANGTFTITDTLSPYNIYVVLRHTDAYRYNNIWLNVGIEAPGDTIKYKRINILLGNDVNGWDGNGLNDIWEIRNLISANATGFKKGEYHFSIAQVMRDSPLENIMSAGLRIEKATP